MMRIADKGCDIVRITVQGRKEADACYDIKNTLVQKGYYPALFSTAMEVFVNGNFFLCLRSIVFGDSLVLRRLLPISEAI